MFHPKQFHHESWPTNLTAYKQVNHTEYKQDLGHVFIIDSVWLAPLPATHPPSLMINILLRKEMTDFISVKQN